MNKLLDTVIEIIDSVALLHFFAMNAGMTVAQLLFIVEGAIDYSVETVLTDIETYILSKMKGDRLS